MSLNVENVENVDMQKRIFYAEAVFYRFFAYSEILFLFVKGVLHKKYPHLFEEDFPQKNVDNVDNYFFMRSFPME